MAFAGALRATDLIKSHGREGIKVYIVYDVSNRMTTTYEAPAGAAHGEQAIKTSYQYDGVTTRITGMKEELSTWDSSWDF